MLFKCSVSARLWLFNLPITERRMLEFLTWRIGVFFYNHYSFCTLCLEAMLFEVSSDRVHLFIYTSNISRACILCQFLCLSLRIIIPKNQSKGEDRETNALKAKDFLMPDVRILAFSCMYVLTFSWKYTAFHM